MSFSAAALKRRSDLIEIVEAVLKTLPDQGASNWGDRGREELAIVEELGTRFDAKAGFKSGSYSFALDGVRASSTMGYGAALDRWLEKAKAFDDE